MSRKVINVVTGGNNKNYFALIFLQDGSFSGELTQEQVEECVGMIIEELYAHRHEFKMAIMRSKNPDSSANDGVYLPGVYQYYESEEDNQIIIAGSYFLSPDGEGVVSQGFSIVLNFDGTFNSATSGEA